MRTRAKIPVKRRIRMQMSYFNCKREHDSASLLAVALKKIGRIRSEPPLRYTYEEISILRLCQYDGIHALVWDLRY